MSTDQETAEIYNKHISDYEELMSKEFKDTNLDIFMEMIVSQGKVLDLGCETGSASLELLRRGLSIFPIDASLEMITVAESLLKIKARKISSDEICEQNFYNAIWANFSVLHITKNQFSDILNKSFFAVKGEGLLFFSLKRGVGESRDKLGRFYSYHGKDEVEKYLEKANFKTRKYTEGASVGLAPDKENWMGFFARRFHNEVLQINTSHRDNIYCAWRMYE